MSGARSFQRSNRARKASLHFSKSLSNGTGRQFPPEAGAKCGRSILTGRESLDCGGKRQRHAALERRDSVLPNHKSSHLRNDRPEFFQWRNPRSAALFPARASTLPPFQSAVPACAVQRLAPLAEAAAFYRRSRAPRPMLGKRAFPARPIKSISPADNDVEGAACPLEESIEELTERGQAAPSTSHFISARRSATGTMANEVNESAVP